MNTLQCPACGTRFDPRTDPFCPASGCGFPADFAEEPPDEEAAPEEILRRPDEVLEPEPEASTSPDPPPRPPQDATSIGSPADANSEPPPEPDRAEPDRGEPLPEAPDDGGSKGRRWPAVAIASVVALIAAVGAIVLLTDGLQGRTETGIADTGDNDAPPPGGEDPDDPAPSTVDVQILLVEAGDPPALRAVGRAVEPPPEVGALVALSDGPTAAERDAGLEVRTSGVHEIVDLDLRDGVATVTLTGGCEPEADGVTIAHHIIPTLRQFDTVDQVHLAHADSANGVQTEHGDVVPACLASP